jgi:hypothetical protein
VALISKYVVVFAPPPCIIRYIVFFLKGSGVFHTPVGTNWIERCETALFRVGKGYARAARRDGVRGRLGWIVFRFVLSSRESISSHDSRISRQHAITRDTRRRAVWLLMFYHYYYYYTCSAGEMRNEKIGRAHVEVFAGNRMLSRYEIPRVIKICVCYLSGLRSMSVYHIL